MPPFMYYFSNKAQQTILKYLNWYKPGDFLFYQMMGRQRINSIKSKKLWKFQKPKQTAKKLKTKTFLRKEIFLIFQIYLSKIL